MNLQTSIHTTSTQSGAHTSTQQTGEQTLLLRRALQADGLFSGISGISALLAATPIATLLGFSTPTAARTVLVIGLGLLAWAALAMWISTRPKLKRPLVFTIIEGNLLWVLATILLLVTGWLPFSTSGKWTIAIVADLVGILALLQYVGWRRIANQ